MLAVWDNMRVIARQRFEEGIMPAWFKPEWLDIEEAPTNTWWRQHGLSAYRQDNSWLGENAPSTSSSGGSGSGGQSGGKLGWNAPPAGPFLPQPGQTNTIWFAVKAELVI